MAPFGVSLAPDDNAWTAVPVWERIDTTYNVQRWSIDRGRPNEMSRTDTGTATVELVDRTGDFDPTNPTGHFFGRFIVGHPMGPLVQAAIALQNPVDSTWATLFRGFIGRLEWAPYRTEQHANVTLELVDGLALLAACEMAPDGSFGHAVIDGNIVYNEDSDGTNAVKTRIGKVLDEVGWPGTLRSLFTGNVTLQKSVYAPRSTALQVIQEAADAEFPDQSNFFVGGPRFPGYMVFRGRFARFNPADVAYNIRTWQLGDDAANTLDPNVVRISPPLAASLDDTVLYSSAYSTPQDPAGDLVDLLGGQYVENPTAVGRYGLRTWSAENLATLGGAGGSTALAETKLFADYVRDNYAVSRVRVGQLTVKPRRPTDPDGPATWELLCNCELGDLVHLTTTHGGGGGFNEDFYVEGIHYQARPGPGDFHIVELTLDVSPRGYYDANPF